MNEMNVNCESVLGQIIFRSRTGRPIFGDDITKKVEGFLQGSLFDVIPDSIESDVVKGYEDEFYRVMGIEPGSRSYGEFLKKYYESRDCGLRIDVSELLYIALPGSYKNTRDDFYRLPAEDYLKTAGAEELFKRWFERDIRCFEELNNGRTPRISEVLRMTYGVLERTDMEYINIRPDGTDPAEKGGYGVRDPFERDDKRLGAYVAANQIWILMVEVPYMFLSAKIK